MKPSASSDCSKGGSTATTSSTTASLISASSLSVLRIHHYYFRGRSDAKPDSTFADRALVQPRRLEQSGAVGRVQHYVEGHAVMVDGERHIDSGGPERPEFAIKLRLACDLFALHGQDDVAGPEFGAARGRPAGKSSTPHGD